MVLLVCLTFVGQAMSSTVMSYRMASGHMMSMKAMSAQEPLQDMSMMDHSNHVMMTDSSNSEESKEDCCVKSCSCFTGGCSNLVTLIGHSDKTSIIDPSLKITSYLSFPQSLHTSSLYRPPILS